MKHQLSLEQDGGVATLGPQVKLKKNTFQGIVVQACDVARIGALVQRVRALPRLRKCQRMPYAMRVRCPSTFHPRVLLESTRSEKEDAATKKKAFRPTEDPTIAEDWEDDGEIGVGDRLLHVLQRWQVENVLLVIARQDDSLSGRLIGQELFKLMTETAKLALEQYYLTRIKASDAARFAIVEASGGTAQYVVSPREEPEDQQQRQQHQRASVCLMTSDTVQSWPQNHQPTSDGGGRKVSKKGRVNHFLYGRKATTTNEDVNAAAEPEIDRHTSPLRPQLGGPEVSDTKLTSGSGIEWLNISHDEWLKLRAIRMPVKELHYLLMCLVVLVDKPLETQAKAAATAKQDEEFHAPSYSWHRCREVLQQTMDWSEQLKGFHGRLLTKSQVTALRSVLQEPTMNEAAFVRIGSASIKLFTWIQRLLDEHDEHELGIAPLTSPQPVVETTEFTPQPPPKHAKQASKQTLTFNSNAEEQALVRELHALFHKNSKKTKIVDRGRLLNHSSRQIP